jgi:hypothetical protein
VKYKSFVIRALKQKPGKWRARVTRERGRPLKSTSRKRREFVSMIELSSPAEAMAFAMEMVDAGKFTRSTERSTERHWRRLSKSHRQVGIKMVDAGTLIRNNERSAGRTERCGTERYWRLLSKATAGLEPSNK